jgi:hypothetical protein
MPRISLQDCVHFFLAVLFYKHTPPSLPPSPSLAPSHALSPSLAPLARTSTPSLGLVSGDL